MGVFRRFSDIISANLNEMVERFEAPETMLRQAIREMDVAVARTMQAAARVIADERLLENQMTRQREESSAFSQRAQESLLGGDEPAARRALLRRNDCEKLVAALNDQLDLARTTGGKVRRQLDAMRVRRAEAERKLHVLVARQRMAETQRKMVSEQVGFGTDDTGFARFDRLCRKIERTEAEADALFELAGGEAVVVDGPPWDQEIENQLQALRQNCQPSAPA